MTVLHGPRSAEIHHMRSIPSLITAADPELGVAAILIRVRYQNAILRRTYDKRPRLRAG